VGASPEWPSVSDLQYFHRNYISGRFTGMYVSERITPIGIAIDGALELPSVHLQYFLT
jgi:hypothetical protein